MRRHETRHSPDPAGAGRTGAAAGRAALVREVVRAAVLPRLLACKDAGAFDRGANVVRLPRRAAE